MYEFAIGKLSESNIDVEAAGVLTVEKITTKEKKIMGVSPLFWDQSYEGFHINGKRYWGKEIKRYPKNKGMMKKLSF